MKITDALVAEHTIFGAVFDQIEKALPSLTTPAEIRTMAGLVEGLLQRHASFETNVAYAALDHLLAQRGELDRMHQEHAELDGRLKTVQTTQSCPEARRLLKAALNAAREHFNLEEKVIFPLLEKSLGTEALKELGKPWLQRGSPVTSVS